MFSILQSIELFLNSNNNLKQRTTGSGIIIAENDILVVPIIDGNYRLSCSRKNIEIRMIKVGQLEYKYTDWNVENAFKNTID